MRKIVFKDQDATETKTKTKTKPTNQCEHLYMSSKKEHVGSSLFTAGSWMLHLM